MTPRPHIERSSKCPRSLPARHPPNGAWPAEMRADMAAAFLDYATTGQLLAAILRNEAPRPTSNRLRNGKREPVWAHEALRTYVANRHEIPSDASPATEDWEFV
jgi:hypothetical protein